VDIAAELRVSIREIGFAVRRPEELALRWRARREPGHEQAAPSTLVFAVLLVNAVVGLAAYGLTMRMHAGAGPMLLSAVHAPLAAGAAWTIALPALYIINSALGSKLDFSTTLLAALVTVSFGAMAMLASVPINWFFALAAPSPAVRLLVNGVVFAGVGVCMADVLLRVVRALEPERPRTFAFIWLVLVGVIGGEFFHLLGVFSL
jgi:hypothetical protein